MRQRVNVELCPSREVHVVSFVMINKRDWKLNGTLKAGQLGGTFACQVPALCPPSVIQNSATFRN